MAIVNAQMELMALKKLLESRDVELLSKLSFDIFGNSTIQNMYKLVCSLYTDIGEVPSFDLLQAELIGRISNPDKLKVYSGLVSDIRDKDASGLTTDYIIASLKEQKQFRIILDGADKLITAVDNRDAKDSIAALREMYDKLFAESAGESFDAADMVTMAGTDVKFNFHKTGFTGLDKRGALIEDGYTIIGGEAKAGKSLAAQQITLYGYDNYDESCAYYTFEQTQKELRTRILSYRSQLDVGLISSELLNEAQRLLLREAEIKHLCYFNDNMKDFAAQNQHLTNEEFWKVFWDHFEPRNSRFYLMSNRPDWDSLFIQLKILAETKKVKKVVLDYPYLIRRGRTNAGLANWEYNLAMSKELKAFAGKNGLRIIAPAQFDSKEDSLRYVKGVINDVDLFIKMKQEDGDKDYGEAGAVTMDFGVFRNYLTVPDEPFLQPFKLLRKFHVSCFENFEF